MKIPEHAAKACLALAGIAIPRGVVARSPASAESAASAIAPVMVKAQIPTGARGKAGGIREAATSAEAGVAARALLSTSIGGHAVSAVLVEERIEVDRELYAAVLNDPESGTPRVMFSTHGGIEIEDEADRLPEVVRHTGVDPRGEIDRRAAARLLDGAGLGAAAPGVADVLVRLFEVYRTSDAELVEINPLAVDASGAVIALDCKLVVDDAAAGRQQALAEQAIDEPLTKLERSARDHGLRYVELGGDVGLLANGAGLTMATMDVISHLGGRPANFLEIGGDAYSKAAPALELVLSQPGLRSLVVNFCGAFARTDVMVDGVTSAWARLRPDIPVFFSVHGTGAAEAREMLVQRLGLEPYPTMDGAITAAISAPPPGRARP